MKPLSCPSSNAKHCDECNQLLEQTIMDTPMAAVRLGCCSGSSRSQCCRPNVMSESFVPAGLTAANSRSAQSMDSSANVLSSGIPPERQPAGPLAGSSDLRRIFKVLAAMSTLVILGPIVLRGLQSAIRKPAQAMSQLTAEGALRQHTWCC